MALIEIPIEIIVVDPLHRFDPRGIPLWINPCRLPSWNEGALMD